MGARFLWAAAVLAGCSPASEPGGGGTARAAAATGSAESGGPEMLVVTVEVRADGGVVLRDAFRAPDRRNPVRGTPPPARFRLESLDAGGGVCESVPFDPSRVRTVEDPSAAGEAAHPRVELPSAPGVVRIGLSAGVERLRVVEPEAAGGPRVAAEARIADLEQAHAARP